MVKQWFTFGQTHVHSVDGFTYDKDVVVEIHAESANKCREKMHDMFGTTWSIQYSQCPNMDYFPRGIKEINV